MTDKTVQARPAELSETTLEAATAGTGHPGGVQFALGDGSVRFVKDDKTPAEGDVLQDLAALNIQRAH